MANDVDQRQNPCARVIDDLFFEVLESSPAAAPGVDCCGESDCHPVSYRLNPQTGREEINANDKWHPVEHDKVLPFPSPDGRVHACWDNPFGGKPNFHCIILPGMTDAEGMTVLSFQA